VPGDPHQVHASGKRYVQVADAISTATKRLRQLAKHPDMQSDAVESFRHEGEKVAADISRAEKRYRGVGEALIAYARPLAEAQHESEEALRLAEQAERDARAADRARHEADLAIRDAEMRARHARVRQDRARHAATTAAAAGQSTSAHDWELMAARRDSAAAASERDAAFQRRHRADVSRREADAMLNRARRKLEEAEGKRDAAARAAIKGVVAVKDSGDLNDGFWENYGAKAFKFIAKLADVIAAVAGIAALLVAWIPVIGQALAAVLGTIALVASLVSLIANLTLALSGDGGWGDVVMSLIGVATFGVGRAAMAGGKLAFAGLRGSARLAAGGRGRTLVHLLGTQRGLAGLTRAGATRMVDDAGRMARFGRNTLREMTKDFSDFGKNIRALGDLPSMKQISNSLHGLGHSGSANEFLTRLSGNADVLKQIAMIEKINPRVLQDTAFRGTVNAFQWAQHGATATGAYLDTSGLVSALNPDPTPAEALDLPRR
jgi:hypothetical protein